MPTLYHYTCDHSRQKIGDAGTLQPLHVIAGRDTPTPPKSWPMWRYPVLDLIWLTDLDTPAADALGLTSRILSCDRTAHRYRATDTSTVMRWVHARRDYPPQLRHELETELGAMPMHWWVSEKPVPVTYDPVQQR